MRPLICLAVLIAVAAWPAGAGAARYLTPSGAWVSVTVSSKYPPDPGRAQQWADFLDSLLHGPEIGSVTLVIEPPADVQAVCGSVSTVACYRPDQQTIYAPGPDLSPLAESLVLHEYGHHLAASRDNAPWQSLDFGPKHWATYMDVCAGTVAGRYFPGAEVSGHYALNPGEGFAETYRVLNEQRLGLPSLAWGLVSNAFLPDAGALAAVQQDVTEPWQADSVSTTSGRFSWRRPARSASVVATTDWPTPLDGPVSVTLKTSKRLRARIDVYAGTDLLATASAGGTAATAGATVCGTRTLSTRVTRLAGVGRFTVSLSSP